MVGKRLKIKKCILVHKHRLALCKFPDIYVTLIQDRISSLSLRMFLLTTRLVVFRSLESIIKIIGICLPYQKVKNLKTYVVTTLELLDG
jgi:hypothetical protein